MQTAQAFICDHCGTVSLHAPYIKGHEKRCLMNPEMKACRSCVYWFKNNREYGNPDNPNRNFHIDPLPFCDHPDADYSLEIDYLDYGHEQEYNATRKRCEGWKWKDEFKIRQATPDFDW